MPPPFVSSTLPARAGVKHLPAAIMSPEVLFVRHAGLPCSKDGQTVQEFKPPACSNAFRSCLPGAQAEAAGTPEAFRSGKTYLQ